MLRICSHFSGGNIICERIDDAAHIATEWLGREVAHCKVDSLWSEYSFPANCGQPLFWFCIPFVEIDLTTFLETHTQVQRAVLTYSEKGAESSC
jgi:hypothetical protein